MMKKTWFACYLLLVFTTFNVFAKDIKAGKWRFELRTTHAAIPFIIDFAYDENKRLTGILHNGEEKIKLEDIEYKEKNIVIPLQTYEISLELDQQSDKSLAGYLVRKNKNPVLKTPVVGVHGIKSRYPGKKKKATINLNGKWSLELKDEKDQTGPAVGVFSQKGNMLTGSILTPTGDYRYLEGVVQKDKFEAASFDGVYNYVFRGNLKDGNLTGEIASNTMTKVSGSKDQKAKLPDAYKQTELPKLKFIFPDLKGQSVSLNHDKFKNKPIIVQIYGSWCPNCLDEMNYLIPWYNENAKRGVEIVALAFERSLSPEAAKTQLLKVQSKLKVPYPILMAGSTSEDKPADKIVGLKNFISFPTTIFLNKKHEVVKVHAGFNGPSTGEFFETWKKEFNQTVDELLKHD
jgi:thiol-disulfide isomerase/thioredoxin